MVKTLKRKLHEILIESGVITEEQLAGVMEKQRRQGGRLGDILVASGYISEEELITSLSLQLEIPPINLKRYRIEPDVIKMLPEGVARHYQILPLARLGNTLTVAMTDPLNVFALDDVKMMTGCDLEPVISTSSDIETAIERYYGRVDAVGEFLKGIEELWVEEGEKGEWGNLDELIGSTGEAPVIRIVNIILSDAVHKRASDILIEPLEKRARIRYRIDGVLEEVKSPPKVMYNGIISRLKIISELDIAERRLPQDGRFKVRIEGREVDFRISIIPSSFGEKAVLRILDKRELQLDIEELGLSEQALTDFKHCADRPHGVILVCGPTGCGKSTTLYSILKYVDNPGKNLVTVEDPVEYDLEGINQVSIKAEIGLTFASALRSILRQDPDVIMVGEIRDYETVDIAIKAALTGHLVLSTLHTTDASGTITRLVNMGVEPFLITSSLLVAAAQRLVRRICLSCKQPYTIPPELARRLHFRSGEQTIFYRGEGCKYCSQTGYRGRIVLAETLVLNEDVCELIMKQKSASEIKRVARKLGMKSLREDGLQKALAGITSLEEVLRVTAEDGRNDEVA